jgi:hypothetical protein
MGKEHADGEPCCGACAIADGPALPASSAPPMRASFDDVVIRVRWGNKDFKEYVPQGPLVRVGRTAPSDLVLPDAVISRRQCTIEMREGRVLVSDDASACGTVVDGQRVGKDAELPEGSSIFVGNFEIRVQRR